MNLVNKYSSKRIMCGLTSLSLLLSPMSAVSHAKSSETAFEKKVASNNNQRVSRESDLTLSDVTSASFDKTSVARSIVITDNDESFKGKLKIVQAANSGDIIRLVYFIFSDDTHFDK